MTKFKNALGTWILTLKDGTRSTIDIKNQAQAKFINDNMYSLNITAWEVMDSEYLNKHD